MNAIDKAINENEVVYLRAKGNVTGPGVLADRSSGVGQTPASLLRASEQYRHNAGWVYVAVRAIATRCAGQDLFVGRAPQVRQQKSLGDAIEPLGQHPLLDAFCNPNPLHSRWAVVYSCVSSICLTGRGYLWLADTDDGLQLWPIPSHWIEPADNFRGGWILKPSGLEAKELEANEICCFTMPDPANPFGSISPLQAQATAVATDESIQNAQFRSFVNGVHPSYAITVGRLPGMPSSGSPGERPSLTREQRRELLTEVRRLYSGTMRQDEPIVLDGMIEGIHKISNSPQEMGYRDSGETVKARILQSFGVNPAIVGQLENANRASSTVAESSFCENTINPLLENLGQTLSAFASRRFSDRLVCWFEKCRADDRELRLQEWRAARAVGDVSRNEYRRHVLNLGDVAGGDDYL